MNHRPPFTFVIIVLASFLSMGVQAQDVTDIDESTLSKKELRQLHREQRKAERAKKREERKHLNEERQEEASNESGELLGQQETSSKPENFEELIERELSEHETSEVEQSDTNDEYALEYNAEKAERDNDGTESRGSSLKTFLVLGGLILVVLFFGRSEKSKTASKSQTKQATRRKFSNSAVYRFRVKGNGSAGGFTYVDGMNVEVAVSGDGVGNSPFNTAVKDLFVQEMARKYNAESRHLSGIKMLFNRDSLDVEVL